LYHHQFISTQPRTPLCKGQFVTSALLSDTKKDGKKNVSCSGN
jgi:hypothetical protein